MRDSATRQVMSLSSPLGLRHSNISHSWRDIGVRLSDGASSIKSLMA